LQEKANRAKQLGLVSFKTQEKACRKLIYKTKMMANQSGQMESDIVLTFREELTQAIEIWNGTPVSILDRQAVHTHALLLA